MIGFDPLTGTLERDRPADINCGKFAFDALTGAIRWALGIAEFSPLSLFASGEQGTWYDPSDFSSMYQDSAGTTPVTAVEQPVGLMLDKSKNGVGTNGAFRYNLLAYTEQFDNAAWTKSGTRAFGSGSIVNAIANPVNGEITADLLTEDTSTGLHRVYYFTATITITVGSSYTQTIYAKSNGRRYLSVIALLGISEYASAVFDLSGGTAAANSKAQGSGWSITSTSQTDLGNGWYKCSMTYVQGTAGAPYLHYALSDTTTIPDNNYGYYSGYTGDGTSGIYIWGASLTTASDASLPYQRITDTWYNTIPGNHASQSTTTSRPILRNRYNLLTYTEQFDNAVWGNLNAATNIVSNATTAPDGTNTADFFRVASTTNTDHLLQQIALSAIGSGTFTLTLRLKPNGITRFRIAATSTAQPAFTNRAWVNTDLSNLTQISGIDGTGFTVVSTSVTPADAYGFHTVSLTYTTTAASIRPYIVMQDESGNFVFAGTIDTGLYIWGASLVPANEASLPYQRVGNGAISVTNNSSGAPAQNLVTPDYDTDTTKFPPYLYFDGVDDCLYTPSNIDFSATDKMSVFAGVRKLSDAAAGTIVNSATASTNYFFTGYGLTAGAASRQNWGISDTATYGGTATAYAAPDTRVSTGLFDLSQTTAATEMVLRLNGSVQTVTFNAAAHATGNFANAALYIGRTNGNASALNGRIYSLITRGALTETPLLEKTEQWVAAKTGVTL